jgi:O-acetyl-ADP-ribose deacetylase (regulator of RNase III)/uncharacterized protein YwgA
MTNRSGTVDVVVGDLFEADAQTLVNTVNCVGVMGKGVALEFKKRFPAMHEDYVARCGRHEVRLGAPYLYKNSEPPHVLNFPTKQHWRAVSRLRDVVAGLDYLQAHYQAWGITSLAVPPLGCGYGGLEWQVVGPTLYQHLSSLEIPVQLYAPFGTAHEELEPRYLQRTLMSSGSSDAVPAGSRLEPGWVAMVATLAELESDSHHWPVGKTSFQKLAYFLTASGLPTGLTFERGTFGPFSPQLTSVVSRLVNNDLIRQVQLGRMIQMTVGGTFEAARRTYAAQFDAWSSSIERTADLLARMRTRDAEVAATVHLVASELVREHGRSPTDEEVLVEVMDWKRRKRPPLSQDEVLKAIHSLAMLGWLDIRIAADMPVDEAALVGF